MVGLRQAGEDIRLVRTRCVRALAVKGLLFLAGVHGFLGVVVAVVVAGVGVVVVGMLLLLFASGCVKVTGRLDSLDLELTSGVET